MRECVDVSSCTVVFFSGLFSFLWLVLESCMEWRAEHVDRRDWLG